MTSGPAAALALLPWVVAAGLAGCGADPATPEDAVRETMAEYENAIRGGDGQRYWSTFSGDAREEAGATDDFSFPPRADYRVNVTEVRVRETTAAAFAARGEGEDAEYEAYFLVKEPDGFRIRRITGGNEPIDPVTFLPPETGRFLAAGQPWDRVARAGAESSGPHWQLARDESFAYARLAFAEPLPAPGQPLPGAYVTQEDLGVSFPPARIAVGASSPATVFTVRVGPTATGHFRKGESSYSLTYSVHVSSADEPGVFSAFVTSRDPLFVMEPSAFRIHLPLEALGATPDDAIHLTTGSGPEEITLPATAF